MRRFAYVLDPLCLVCCALYAINRWLIKPHCPLIFFHYWFNDILLIPCALPPLLLVHRWLRLRPADAMPTLGEIGWHLAGWSVLFEGIGPHIMRTTGDPWDVVAYCGGSVVAAVWWRGKVRRTAPTLQEVASEIGGGHRPPLQEATFDGLARHYRWMERVLAGGKLQRCRVAFLVVIPEPRHALLVGEGHGRFLVELRRKYPKARCLCVDSSAGMLEQARAAMEAAGLSMEGVQFLQTEILEWTPPAKEFDLIATHFVLDCFRLEQLEGLVGGLADGAAPGARWLLADFREPAAGLAKWRARLILQAMYVFFRWAAGLPAVRLTPPDGLLARTGFVLRERRIFEWGLLHSDLWEQMEGRFNLENSVERADEHS